jgi:hypothetical protein
MILLHIKNTTTLTLTIKSRITFQLISFIFVYLFIQLNFDLVSHNFGTRTHQFVNSYYSYLLGLIVLSCCGFFLLKTTSVKKVNNRKFLWSLVYGISILLIILSFIELWINFLWLLLNLNVFNVSINFQYWVLILILLLFFGVHISNFYLSLILIYVLPLSSNLKLLFLSFLNLKLYNVPHKLILLWVSSTLVYINASILEWSISTTNQNYLTFKLNNIYVELINQLVYSNYINDFSWSFLNKTSVPLNQSFLHFLTTDTVNQALQSFTLEFIHIITIIDYTITHLVTLLFLWIILNIYFSRKINLIIF